MSEAIRYVARITTQVTIIAITGEDDETLAGGFTVETCDQVRGEDAHRPVKLVLDTALARQVKKVRAMGAGVENLERNRLK